MSPLIRNQAATGESAQGGVGSFSYVGGLATFPRNGVERLEAWTAVRAYRPEIIPCGCRIEPTGDLDGRGIFGAGGVGG